MQLEVNPNTVQRAYLELEREMLVFTKRGQGTFIVEEPQIALNLGQEMGTVEYIGIKSTRLRSLSGEQIVDAEWMLASTSDPAAGISRSTALGASNSGSLTFVTVKTTSIPASKKRPAWIRMLSSIALEVLFLSFHHPVGKAGSG